MTNFKNKLYYLLIFLMMYSCSKSPDDNVLITERNAALEPDYTGITIPPNIAPLNFMINEEGSAYLVKFSGPEGRQFEVYSKDGNILIPERKWKLMLQENKGKEIKVDIFARNSNKQWQKFSPVTWNIAVEKIDPYLSYRLLYPGYESWRELSIKQRSLVDFREHSVIENTVVDENCINCHAYNNGRSDDFLFHMRGTLGGTYFYSGGKLVKTNLKTEEMANGAVYPRWHPSGKFVAFSSNKIVQRFHSANNKKVEVSDLESSLVMYDIVKNEMMNVELADKEEYMDTYPEWSPDGRYLYFCRAEQIGEVYDYREIRYNLYRTSFDQDNKIFENTEIVFDAAQINKSVSFPRISPDGKYLVLTLADYGCFPIWHKEADLWLIDLETFEPTRLELNSECTDSYHSWSSNGKWLVFSSKRTDGLTARPYMAYIGENGNSSKPFVLPQKDPEFYNRFLKSYNIPEFSSIKIDLNPGRIRRVASAPATQAGWSEM
jgi:WD40 repeat protein